MAIKSFERALLGSTALAVGAAGAATAQDISGFYGGVSLGFATGGDFDFNGDVYAFDGSSGGIFAGYNFVNGAMVYGVELGWTDGYDLDVPGLPYGISLDSIIDVRARAGYVFGNSMAYGAIGYWKGDTLFDGFFGPGSPGVGDADGVSLAVGFETALGDKGFIGGEIMRRTSDVSEIYGIDYFDGLDLTTASIRAGFRF